MITIDFSNRGNMGLCEYLYSEIRLQILNGTLKPNEKLPSKRVLSSHLKVSIITVQNAYNELISLGYIYSIEKKGFYVTDLSDSGNALRQVSFNKFNEDAVVGPTVTAPEKNFQEYFADLNSNESASQKFPFKTWAKLMRRVLNSENPALLEKQNVFGVYDLRISISNYLRQFRNMKTEPEQIVIGAGTESLYSMLVQFLGREKLYAVENPGYHKVASIIELNGACFAPIEMDSQGINISQLEKSNAQVLHLSPSHHFPSGIVTSIKRRSELLAWMWNDKNRFIIEDEYDSEFRFNGKPIQPLQNLAETNADENRIIYINTFSKTLSPSFRLSYMVLPKKLLPAFKEKLGFFACPVPTFEQYTLSLFINEGHYEKHLIKMKNYYKNLRNAFITAIDSSNISRHGKILEEESGLHFLLQVKTFYTKEEIKHRLNEEKINLPFLSDFNYNSESKLHEEGEKSENTFTFVVNYSTLSRNLVGETVNKIEKIFN